MHSFRPSLARKQEKTKQGDFSENLCYLFIFYYLSSVQCVLGLTCGIQPSTAPRRDSGVGVWKWPFQAETQVFIRWTVTAAARELFNVEKLGNFFGLNFFFRVFLWKKFLAPHWLRKKWLVTIGPSKLFRRLPLVTWSKKSPAYPTNPGPGLTNRWDCYALFYSVCNSVILAEIWPNGVKNRL